MPTTTYGTDPRADIVSPTNVTTGPDRVTLLGAWRATRSADLSGHVAHHGPAPLPSPGDASWPERFADAVEASGLTGRGGASFPSAAKIKLVRSTKGRSTLVVNAMEGEPASAKDRTLLTCVPHLVLDGAELAACALGATRIVVCIPEDRRHAVHAIGRAVAERSGTALSPVPVEVLSPPGRFVAGEESALVSWLDQGPGAPTWRPDKGTPLSIGRGLGRGPALVHNAETLAHMGLIARHGPATFRATGLPDAPGTSLVTVSGGVEHPGVYEVAMGTPLGGIVRNGEPTDEVVAVLTGGYGGSWVPAAALATPYSPRGMAAVGGVMGAGVLVVLTGQACGIVETARMARYMAGESAGQCGPCVFGLPVLADDLERLAHGAPDPDVVRRIELQADTVNGRGACRHPDGVVRMVRSALSVFADDAAAHAAGRPCPGRRLAGTP